MSEFDHMTDAELIAARDHARKMAHDAPKSDIGQHSDAWARWSRRWAALADEANRRAAIISGEGQS